MKIFDVRAPGVLSRMEPSTRLVYTAFLVLTLGGMATAALLHADAMGLDRAAAYWRGDEATMDWPKSYRQILELTHFHLFTEPITFLVVAHLYNLTGDAQRRKVLAVSTTLAAMVAQMALPWLITYGSARFAVAFAPAHALLALGLGYMSLGALAGMWWSSPES